MLSEEAYRVITLINNWSFYLEHRVLLFPNSPFNRGYKLFILNYKACFAQGAINSAINCGSSWMIT